MSNYDLHEHRKHFVHRKVYWYRWWWWSKELNVSDEYKHDEFENNLDSFEWDWEKKEALRLSFLIRLIFRSNVLSETTDWHCSSRSFDSSDCSDHSDWIEIFSMFIRILKWLSRLFTLVDSLLLQCHLDCFFIWNLFSSQSFRWSSEIRCTTINNDSLHFSSDLFSS